MGKVIPITNVVDMKAWKAQHEDKIVDQTYIKLKAAPKDQEEDRPSP